MLSISQLRRSVQFALSAVLLVFSVLAFSGCANFQRQPESKAEIGFLDIGEGVVIRRMLVKTPTPKGVVLFLHGFPETLYVWKEVALSLGSDFEVHAFDWPGYGLSTRPPADQFSYSPKDYAHILKDYIVKSGIDTSKLVIYATDIGALPALLLAVDEPGIAKAIVVGDFAPFDRPQYMYPGLQSLKSTATSEAVHASMNKTRDEILENAFRRGLTPGEQFEPSPELKDDMLKGWSQNDITSADAFYYYYSHFTRDQNFLESNLGRLTVPIKVIWGAKDIYINPAMGAEFAIKTNSPLTVLPGLGHYPHLQSPAQTIREIRAVDF